MACDQATRFHRSSRRRGELNIERWMYFGGCGLQLWMEMAHSAPKKDICHSEERSDEESRILLENGPRYETLRSAQSDKLCYCPERTLASRSKRLSTSILR